MHTKNELNTKTELTETEKIKKLKEQLWEIINDKKNIYYVHGTGAEVISSILKEGLHTRSNNLLSTSIPLSFKEERHEVFKKILHWPHRNYKRIVFIALPIPTKKSSNAIAYTNSLFSPLTQEEVVDVGIQGADRRYVIPTHFLRGYLDVDTLTFHPNPEFVPDPSETLAKKAQSSFHERYQRVIKFEQTPPITPLPTTHQQNEEIDEDIW